jgi:NADH:ubiquinone oxidoreductase subunit D
MQVCPGTEDLTSGQAERPQDRQSDLNTGPYHAKTTGSNRYLTGQTNTGCPKTNGQAHRCGQAHRSGRMERTAESKVWLNQRAGQMERTAIEKNSTNSLERIFEIIVILLQLF